MKKLLKTILLAVFVLMTQYSNAQSLIGAKASLQYSTIDIQGSGANSLVNPTNVQTYTIGAVYHAELGSGFFFRPELLFTRRGFDAKLAKNIDLFGDFGLELGLGVETEAYAISMPLNLGYSIDLGKAKLQMYAGPSIDYNTKAILKTYASAGVLRLNISKNTLDLSKDMFNRFELGGTLGANLAIPVRTGEILIDGRINKSFTNFLNDPILDLEITNRSYSFGLGYMHRI